MVHVNDKSPQAQTDPMTKGIVLHDNTQKTTATVLENIEVKLDTVPPKELKDNGNSGSQQTVTLIGTIQETISDLEGWQEANPKGRSGNTSNRRISQRKPELAKLNVSSSEYSNYRESSYRREINTSAQRATPKTVSTLSSPSKQRKVISPGSGEDLNKPQVKTPVSKISSAPANLTALASKSVSYKAVAVAPPGTILKPIPEKVEEKTKEEAEIQTPNSRKTSKGEESDKVMVEEEAAPEDEDTKDSANESGTDSEKPASEPEEVFSSSDNQEKPAGTKGSKLSAAAPPFNPGAHSLIHTISSAAVTSVYDVTASQGMLAEPTELPSVAARVPCGPRSAQYYRTNKSFRIKNGCLKYQNPVIGRSGFGPSRIMNPHAPEFIPRRAWQTNTANADTQVPSESDSFLETNKEPPPEENLDKKAKASNAAKDGGKRNTSDSEKAELARQILLSFIVKSVQQNMDSPSEAAVNKKKHEHIGSSSDAIANDSAIIKILYRDEAKTTVVSESSESQQAKTDVNKNKNGDGEGFTVVTKRRRNRQHFTNGVNGLHNQQSICASVR